MTIAFMVHADAAAAISSLGAVLQYLQNVFSRSWVCDRHSPAQLVRNRLHQAGCQHAGAHWRGDAHGDELAWWGVFDRIRQGGRSQVVAWEKVTAAGPRRLQRNP